MQRFTTVLLQTDIQTATQRISLNSTDPNDSNGIELEPDPEHLSSATARSERTWEPFVSTRSDASGIPSNERQSIFSLVCTVTCIDLSGEKCNLKKVFKLPVSLDRRGNDQIFSIGISLGWQTNRFENSIRIRC